MDFFYWNEYTVLKIKSKGRNHIRPFGTFATLRQNTWKSKPCKVWPEHYSVGWRDEGDGEGVKKEGDCGKKKELKDKH